MSTPDERAILAHIHAHELDRALREAIYHAEAIDDPLLASTVLHLTACARAVDVWRELRRQAPT